MRQDLGKLLQQGLIQGKGARAIAKDLKKYWYGNDPKTGGGATYCMERLMRTELARVQTEAQKQSFERNGFDMYQFICNENPTKHGTCSICRGLNGRHFKVADMMPGTNAPPMHPHCRCSVAAWEDNQDYEEWLDYLDRGGSTESWNNLKNRVENIEKNPSKALEKSATGSIIKLDNKNVREWYVNSVSMIKENIPTSLPLEDKAKQAFESRNRIRITAREMMDDEARRLKLYKDKKNKSFEELIKSKMKRKGLTYEEALQDIFDTATKTNADVNKEFGID
jgi:SPP1 gp7 family putative phage head morphogenesis protein